MKILVVSNIYPPHVIGGYELACRESVIALREQGHAVIVITGRHETPSEEGVRRHLDVCFTRDLHIPRAFLKEFRNQREFRKICRIFQPDVIYFWNLRGISLSAAVQAAKIGIPAVWYVFDNWLATPEMDHWRQVWLRASFAGRRIISAAAKSLGLTDPADIPPFSNVCFASEYLRNLVSSVGVNVTQAKVVPWGVQAGKFSPPAYISSHPRRILYVGQIAPLKGVHTLVRAIALLFSEYEWSDISLTIAGDTELVPEYTSFLRELADGTGISHCVTFAGKIPHSEIASIYRQHDILVFPSSWEEPFGITQLEGMASGLVVAGTATGGSAEILIDGVNALVFKRDDPADCARTLHRLREEEGLSGRLRENGCKTVGDKFNFGTYVDEMCHTLWNASWSPSTSCISSKPELTRRAGSTLPSLPHKILSTLIALPFYMLRNFVSFFLQASRTSAEPKSIVVVQTGNRSDVLTSLPFVHALRNAGVRIVVMIDRKMLPLVDGFLEADKILPIPFNGLESGRHTRGRLLWWLNSLMLSFRNFWSAPPDAAVSLRWENDSRQAAAAALLHMSLAPELHAFKDPGKGIYALMRNHFILGGIAKVPAWDYEQRQRQLLAAVLPQATYEQNLPLSVNTRKDGEGTCLVLAPGGGGASFWKNKNFVELSSWVLQSYKVRSVVVAFDEDRMIATNIAAAVDCEALIVRGWLELAETLSSSILCVGSDPTILSVAALNGIPYVYLCGPEDFRSFPSTDRGAIVRLDIACSPCGGDCMLPENVCMGGLSIEKVKKSIAAVIPEQRGGKGENSFAEEG